MRRPCRSISTEYPTAGAGTPGWKCHGRWPLRTRQEEKRAMASGKTGGIPSTPRNSPEKPQFPCRSFPLNLDFFQKSPKTGLDARRDFAYTPPTKTKFRFRGLTFCHSVFHSTSKNRSDRLRTSWTWWGRMYVYNPKGECTWASAHGTTIPSPVFKSTPSARPTAAGCAIWAATCSPSFSRWKALPSPRR